MQICSYLRLFICVVLWFKSYLLNTFAFFYGAKKLKKYTGVFGQFLPLKAKNRAP